MRCSSSSCSTCQTHRLCSCSLVSKAFHAAAAAGTQQLSVSFGQDAAQHSQNTLDWMARYGQHVTCLCICGFPQPLAQLPPLKRLQKLELFGCQVQLGPAAAAHGQPGVLCSCPKLTRLEVSADVLDAPLDDGKAVVDCSCLADLQHLRVRSRRFDSPVAGLSSASLPRLQCLTYLNIDSLSAENLLQLGALSALQSLELRAGDSVAVGPNSVPGFVLPASLTQLVLWSRMEAGLLSVVPTGLQHLDLSYCVIEGPAEGPGSFLAGMARLQQLTRLVLLPHGDMAWPPPGPAYSALTASSGLVSFEADADLPGGVWPFVFPAGHALPHLTSLTLPVNPDHGPVPPFAWGPADIASMVMCCPSVCDIHSMAMQHGEHVSRLHELTALTRVNLEYGTGWRFWGSFRGLAAVGQLRCLAVRVDVRPLPVAALLPLTSLTALSRLVCKWLPADDADSSEDAEADMYMEEAGLELSLAVDKEDPIDVWLQLLMCCADEPNCQLQVWHSLSQQLAGDNSRAVHRALAMNSHGRLWTQQQRIDGYKRRMVQQEQRIAQQEEHIQGLEQQLIEHKQQAAERVAELQGQLGELQKVVQQLLQRVPLQSG